MSAKWAYAVVEGPASIQLVIEYLQAAEECDRLLQEHSMGILSSVSLSILLPTGISLIVWILLGPHLSSFIGRMHGTRSSWI